jgi:DNA-binding MarR family transcriptional regulator
MTTTAHDRQTPEAGMGLERTLSYRLHLLHKLTDQQSQHAYPRETGLTLSDGRCLATIGSFEPVSVKDLAERANLDKGQASRAAQALVEQGLVSKQASPQDSRAVLLALTPAGRQAWARTMALIERRNEEMFACLSPAERASLGEMLDRLIRQAREA